MGQEEYEKLCREAPLTPHENTVDVVHGSNDLDDGSNYNHTVELTQNSNDSSDILQEVCCHMKPLDFCRSDLFH